MSKLTKILVPIDFSPCSENALAYALQLADEIDGIVEVLNVPPLDIPYTYPAFVAVTEVDKIKTSRKLMNRSIEKVIERLKGSLEDYPDLQTDIEIGVPDTKICEIADRDHIDYIIMGTQGENSIWDRFLGTTASNVLKYSTNSVMLIPEEVQFEDHIVMGYATDFLDSDPFEIWRASRLLKAFHPKIIAMHINEKNEFDNSKVKELEAFFVENAPAINISFYSLFAKDIVNDLNSFIKDHKINMMVMYKEKRNFFESLFHKSFTNKMALHLKVPLLVLKEQ